MKTHRVTSHHLLALLSRKPAGLILEVTDGTRECNDSNHRVSTFYDLVKDAPLRMAFTLVHELRPHRCTAVAVSPGRLRSEMVLENYGVDETTWKSSTAEDGHFAAISDSPRFVSRGVAALAADPSVFARTGASFCSGGPARDYGITDVDGSVPDC
ncbi:hypothetical protein [Paeniglutamicibacter antarcticus]|uniref:hypothetical protein n=1 Tax=Paeniglutamicibacter antarcticus TaxID=494023 RepID=UPI0031EA5A61